MSQSGDLAWYANVKQEFTPALLVQLAELIGAEVVDDVYMSNCRATSSIDAYIEDKLVGENVTRDALPDFYSPDSVTTVNADFAQLGEEISLAIETNIPEEIRGQFMPDRPFFSVGQDWWCDASEPEVRVPYRVLVGCWGYSTPNHTEQMQKQTLSLPEVQQVAERLEEIVEGEVSTALYYYF